MYSKMVAMILAAKISKLVMFLPKRKILENSRTQ